ncbi:phosphotransferase [Lacibacterium aquatile]|uniref:Phosphotransferase n=1 Tax=Lacibacterium aquatile TaxID=1168082 RepID=A0ABW5DSL9_9PROT
MNIPATWTEPVREALYTAFSVIGPDRIKLLTGGLSGAPVFWISIAGMSYLLRLDSPVEGIADPRRWHRCLHIAAEAGVSPRVLFTGASGVSITDFITPDPTGSFWRQERRHALGQVGDLLRRLHAAPAFPPLIDYLDGVRALAVPVIDAKPLAAFDQVAAVYRRLEPQLVPSHNDVNPRNLLHDGQRLWLVDWAASFQADRYIDLAAIGSFVARDAEGANLLLTAYFDRPPSEGETARFELARLINHFFYGGVMLSNSRQPTQRRNLDALHLALRIGEPLLDTPEGRAEYGLARLAALVAAVEDPGFEAICRLAT